MEKSDTELRKIWRQPRVPVIFRQSSSTPLMVKLPYAPDNLYWLKNGRRNNPSWNQQYKCWATPKTWFEDLAKRAIERFGPVYVIQPTRDSQKCAPICWNARGLKCECSCLGSNHGSEQPSGRWHVVSETFAVNWQNRKYSCRLINRVD